MREVEMPSGHVVYDVPDGTTQTQLAQMYPQFMTEKPSALPENAQQPGLLPAIKRGMRQRGVGILQTENDLESAGKKYLPDTLANILPEEGDIKNRGEMIREVAGNLQNQGKGTGFIGTLGEMLGDPLTYMFGGGNALKAGAIYGGTSGATSPQTRDIGIEGRAKNAAIEAPLGAALSYGGSKLAEKLIQPFKNKLTGEEQRLAQIAEEQGIKLSAGQKGGNRMLQGLESSFNNNPLTMGAQEEARRQNLGQYTKAVLSKIGGEGEEATPEVISKAYKNAGKKIEELTNSADMPVDDKVINDTMQLLDKYSDDIIDPLQKQTLSSYANAVTKDATLPGRSYQNTRSELGRIAKSYWASSPHYANAIDGLQEIMDDAMGRALKPEKAAEFIAARQQYGATKTVMKAMASTGKDATAGYIPPAALAQAVKGANPTSYVQGNGPLNDIARIGTSFIKPPIGDSQTATRLMWQNLLTGGGLGYAAGGAAGAGVGALPELLRYFGPYAAQKAYNKMPNYLSNGANISPEARALAKALAGRAAAENNPLKQ